MLPKQVPDEAWHAAMSTYHKVIKKRPGSAWQEAIAAGLQAWPGVGFKMNGAMRTFYILPLPQESSDD